MTTDDANAVLGNPLPRLDGHKKVTGTARFSGEHFLPGMKYACLIHSTIASGTIEEIDASQAKKVAGVAAVITHENALRLNLKKPIPMERGLLVMQDNRVHHDRQIIGVVVADTLEAANYAASLVRIKYATNVPNVDFHSPAALQGRFKPPDRLDAPDAPLKIATTSWAYRSPVHYSRGDASAALEAAAVKMSASYSTARLVHVPMEMHTTIAAWEGERLTVYDSTQGVAGVVRRLSILFDVPPENIHLLCKFTGGGFGSKGGAWSHVPAAVMAARMVNAPICLTMQRTQSFGPVGWRAQTVQKLTLGADRGGHLTALEQESTVETSSFDYFLEPATECSRHMYSCPSVSVTSWMVPIDIGMPTFLRGPGFSANMYALECAMDELAYAVNVDPLELRRINYAEIDESNSLPYSSKHLKACYDLGAQRFGWSGREPKPRSTRRGHKLIGMGMASAVYLSRLLPSTASATINGDGSATILSGSQEIGTGTYTIITQVAADSLGLRMEQVHFDLGDSDYPKACASVGSVTPGSTGSAVKLACDAVLEKLIKLAVADSKSPLFGAKPEEITARDGKLIARQSKISDGFADILSRSGLSCLEATASYEASTEKPRYSTWSFGCHFCEVHVDEDFGTVKVARWVGVFDGGKIFNQRTARSQLEGSIVWGIGMALMEQSSMDLRYGRTINADLADYHIPVNADVPALDVSFIEHPDYIANPLGGRGIGQLAVTGAPAAIANAIFHATGARVRELPITPDKLIRSTVG